jgi:hypothetical protein
MHRLLGNDNGPGREIVEVEDVGRQYKMKENFQIFWKEDSIFYMPSKHAHERGKSSVKHQAGTEMHHKNEHVFCFGAARNQCAPHGK